MTTGLTLHPSSSSWLPSPCLMLVFSEFFLGGWWEGRNGDKNQSGSFWGDLELRFWH